MSITLPDTFEYGKVVGRFILAVADTADEGRLPDATAPSGTITFTPATPMTVVSGATPVTVVKTPIRCTVSDTGELIDPTGVTGVWLIAGVYKVSYAITGVSLLSHDIVVLPEHTDLNPLDLTNAAPPPGPAITPTQYAALVAMIEAIPGGGTGGGEPAPIDEPALQEVLLRMLVPWNDINIYKMAAPNDEYIAFNVLGMDGLRDDIEALQTQTTGFLLKTEATNTYLTQADAATTYATKAELAGYATDAELAAVAQSTGLSDVVFVTALENIPPGTPTDTLIVVRAP